MNIIEKLHELSAKIELARGDRAAGVLKRIGEMSPPGEGFVSALRKNPKQYRRAYNKWMGENLTPQQATSQMQHIRDSIAGVVRKRRKA